MKLLIYLFTAVLSITSVRASHLVYDFINSGSGAIGNGFAYAPVINNNGLIAFAASTQFYNEQMGLIYGNLNAPGTIHQLNNIYTGSILTNAFAINDQNDVLWIQDDFGDRTMATANPATPNAPVLYGETTRTAISGRSPGMNQSGFFTFRDSLDGSVVSIFDSNTSTIRSLSVSGNLRWEGPSAINDHGQVIYGTDHIGGGLFVYDWNSDATAQLTPSNVTIPQDQSLPTVQPTLNNQGLAAFFAKDNETDQTGLYTIDINSPIGEAHLIASIAQYVIAPLSINEGGQVLFLETTFDGEAWEDSLKLWDGETLQTLLSTGDAFGESSIFELSLSGYALNDDGTVVFGYLLNDGSRGVGYILIPEPSVFLLILPGAVIFYLLRRRGATV